MLESVYRGGLLLGGCLLPGGVSESALGVSASRGGVCSGGFGGVCSRGMSALGGVSAPGGCLLPGGILACTEAETPPPVDRITDTSKNITLATTSLRPVMTVHLSLCYSRSSLLSPSLSSPTSYLLSSSS